VKGPQIRGLPGSPFFLNQTAIRLGKILYELFLRRALIPRHNAVVQAELGGAFRIPLLLWLSRNDENHRLVQCPGSGQSGLGSVG
jgi:hypothetical protein